MRMCPQGFQTFEVCLPFPLDPELRDRDTDWLWRPLGKQLIQ